MGVDQGYAFGIGFVLALVVLASIVVILARFGKLPSATTQGRSDELSNTVNTLLKKLNEQQREIDALKTQLASANARIAELEHLADVKPKPAPVAAEERVLLAVVGNEPGLKLDLAALREVESESGIVVTRCFPARFARFEATLNRYRAAGTPIKYVHFSVHATAGEGAGTEGALFMDDVVSGERLSGVLNGVEVAFVAGCNAETLGDLMGVVPTVVTFKEDVGHEHAHLATKVFWLAIGRGLPGRAAYREARSRLPAEVAEYLELHQ